MRVSVVGPGALGCLHAALLSRAGVEVCLLDHRPDRARLLTEHGLTVEDGGCVRAVAAVGARTPSSAEVAGPGAVSAPSHGDDNAPPPATAADEGVRAPTTTAVICSADPRDLPQPDVLLFCVKTFQTEAAAHHAAPLAGPDTVVLRLQNGLADPAPLVAMAAPERVVLGTSGHGANTVGWGHIRHAGSGPTRLGPLVPSGMEGAERAAEALRPGFPDTEVVDDVLPVLWRKLLANVAINPLTALTGLRNGQLLEVPLLRAAMADLASEAECTAIAAGISLNGGQGLALAEAACRQTAGNRSSMLQDVESGRPTEIEDICGAVVREATRLGLPAPLNQAMVHLVSEVLPSPPTNRRASRT
jgi:2-dehydropantoate 2-reductase